MYKFLVASILSLVLPDAWASGPSLGMSGGFFNSWIFDFIVVNRLFSNNIAYKCWRAQHRWFYKVRLAKFFSIVFTFRCMDGIAISTRKCNEWDCILVITWIVDLLHCCGSKNYCRR
jgi:predicted ferric reductase